MIAPSGAQIEIAAVGQRAVVVEVGGGLRSYSADGRDLIDGYAADAMRTAGRGQLMIPWPNRLQDGSYEFEGRRHQLPLSEPDTGNAIHGLVRWCAWTVVEREPHRTRLEHVLHAQRGYPFTIALSIEYTLREQGLSVRTTAENRGSDRCPFGSGAHPYLTLGTATVDQLILRAPGCTVLLSDGSGLPIGSKPVDGTDYDFRSPKAIGSTRLDDAFTDLDRGEDGLARVDLADPHDGTGLTVWVDESYPYLMLFTGDALSDIARRSLAVEPMTCPPNAFRSGEALIRLEPGDSFAGVWGIRPNRT